MRQILLMTGAVLLAAGCAKQTAPVEGGGPEDLAIRVSAQVDGMTRSSYGAGIPESLKEFDLLVETFVDGVAPWGFDNGYNYNNSKFTYDSGSGEWTPSAAASKMLWYNSTTKVRVAAMAPCRTEGSYAIGWDPRVGRLLSDASEREYITFEVQAEQSRDNYDSDLLFYYKKDVTPKDLLQDGKLPIVFRHMLSSLVITFKLGTQFNDSGVPAQDIISDMVVSGTKRTVRFVKEPSEDELYISAVGDASDVKPYNASWTPAADKNGNCISVYECILAPQTVAAEQFKLSFKVDGKDYSWTLPSEYEFTGNYVHRLNLRVGKDDVALGGTSATKWEDVDRGTIVTD